MYLGDGKWDTSIQGEYNKKGKWGYYWKPGQTFPGASQEDGWDGTFRHHRHHSGNDGAGGQNGKGKGADDGHHDMDSAASNSSESEESNKKKMKCVFSDAFYYKKAPSGRCFGISKTKATWEEAYIQCQYEDAYLAILRNPTERAFVHNMMMDVPDSVEHWQFHVGIRSDLSEDQYEPGQHVTFKNIFGQSLASGYAPWGPGEPNNEYGVEYCVTMFKSTGMYNDSVCSYRYCFICQKKRSKPMTGKK